MGFKSRNVKDDDDYEAAVFISVRFVCVCVCVILGVFWVLCLLNFLPPKKRASF